MVAAAWAVLVALEAGALVEVCVVVAEEVLDGVGVDVAVAEAVGVAAGVRVAVAVATPSGVLEAVWV